MVLGPLYLIIDGQGLGTLTPYSPVQSEYHGEKITAFHWKGFQ